MEKQLIETLLNQGVEFSYLQNMTNFSGNSLRDFPLYNFIFEANIHPLYVAEIRFRCRVGKRHAIEDFYNELRYVKIYKIIVKYATILNNNFHYF